MRSRTTGSTRRSTTRSSSSGWSTCMSSPSRRLAPPTGAAAPLEVPAPDDSVVDLRSLAKQVCARYRSEFSDEQERYGDAGQAWCVHDNQYILHWAILDARGTTTLHDQIAW